MDQAIERNLWRVSVLVILLTQLQASTGCSRRNPAPSKCGQSEWSSWSECLIYHDVAPITRARYRQTQKNNKCITESLAQCCIPHGGRQQHCRASSNKCARFPGIIFDSAYGKKCNVKADCHLNGGRGPCSHSCESTNGDYFCLCKKGYQIEWRTECVLQNCAVPRFSPCPEETSKKRFKLDGHEFYSDLPLCENVKYVCRNGTTYNAECTLSCPRNYKLAFKDENQPWWDYGAFDFNTPSSHIMCHVFYDSVTWNQQLDRYVCRRSNDPPVSIKLDSTHIKESQRPGTVVGRLISIHTQYQQNIVYSAFSPDQIPSFRCRDEYLESLVVFKWNPKGQNSYQVLIRVQNNNKPRMWFERVFNITVTNVDDAPRNIEISKNSVYENATVGTIVGTLSAIDDDVGQERSSLFSWKLLGISENFEISGANVVVKKTLNYDILKVHYIKVHCNDSLKYSETELQVYVMNYIEPPTIALTGNKIPENSLPGTVIAKVEAKSESSSDITFSLSASNAHVREKFTFSPQIPFCQHDVNAIKFITTCYVNLTASGKFDYEDQNQFILQVVVKNNEGSCFYKKWSVSVEDVNEKPDKMDFNGSTQISEVTKSEEDFCFLVVSDPDNANTMNQIHVCHVINQGGDGQYFQVNSVTNALQIKVNKTLNYERQQTYHVSLTCTDNGIPPLSITQDIIINVTDVNEAPGKGCSYPLYVSPQLSSGTVLGYLNVTDPDNEIFDTKSQENCEKKQQLRITIDSEHEDLLPFKVADGYLVKYGEIQANKTYSLLISVEDDGVVSNMSSDQMVYNKIAIRFNCTVISTNLVRPYITLSANHVDKRAENETIIGFFNTTKPTYNYYYGNGRYKYQLVNENCSSYPFVVYDNQLRLEIQGERRVSKNKGETLNHVIIQVKSSGSGWSNDVITTLFLVLIRDESKLRSRICLTNATILENDALYAKLGPIRVISESSNNTLLKCPEENEEKEKTSQGNFVCDVNPSFKNSSTDFKKVNLTNRIYIDHEMFLRINTSLEDKNLKLDKFVVKVTCWDCKRPLHLVKGDVTVFLQDYRKDCLYLKPECKPSKNPQASNWKRNYTLCAQFPPCPEHFLCSKMVNSTQRCIGSADQLFIGLSFLLGQNSHHKFEKFLQDVLKRNYLEDLVEERSDQYRQKRDTKNKFSVEILDVKLSQKHKKSLAVVAIWKIEKSGLQLERMSSFPSLFENTNGIVFIETMKDCAIFQETGIDCPINKNDMSSDSRSEEPLEMKRFLAIFGLVILIILIIERTVKIGKLREDGRHKDADLIKIRQTLNSTMSALETSNRQRTRLQVQHNANCRSLASTQKQIGQLRNDCRRKDADLIQVRNSKAAVERTLNSTRTTLETSNRQRMRLQVQHNECCQSLASTQAQVERLNSERREEENFRNWTIPRDEIEISEKEIGRGGWGSVNEGTFRGTKVAVKQMHELIVSPHNRRLFEREMKMAARSHHPNLLLFIGATNDDGIALLVTELLDTNLRTLLGQRRLHSKEILTLSLDLSRALNYLHMSKPHPIIHRDISSANVLLFKREEAWHAKLSDYGTANFMQDSMTENPGAAIYAAPEARASIQSPKVDVYSFGLLLCEMCTRELPVPEQRNVQIRLITDDHLRELVQQCTNETSKDRPTMDDVLLTLQNLCPSTQ